MAKNDTPEIPGLFDDLPEEAPQEQIAKISLRSWRTHLASIRTLDKRIEKLIDEAVKQALAQGRKLTSADIGRVFQRHPELRAALDKTMQQLNDDLTATIEEGSKDAWFRANTAADTVVAAMANNNAQLAALLNAGTNKPQNDRALRAFQQREMQGLKLSDRVWRATEGMKLDMERAIEVALAEGVPAQKLSERVRELLKEPHRLYRRVRDKDGNLRLSQAAQKYHPGTGVYRSSYKNAMRVARTEVNMAYQASDSERWTRSWWVKGIRVSLSNNHTSPDSKGRPAPLVDICDELAGDYPADFKFTGWHPQCRCFATAITCEYADIRDYYRRKRAGEDMTGYTPPGTITEPPEQFKRWMTDNADRLAGAAQRGTTPYFIANNTKYTDPNWKPIQFFRQEEFSDLQKNFFGGSSVIKMREMLKAHGYTKEDWEELSRLIDTHRHGGENQKDADIRIAIAFRDSESRLGAMLRLQSEIEEEAYRIYRMKNPPITVYRAGGMERDTFSFTMKKGGVTKIIEGQEVRWGADLKTTLDELMKDNRLAAGLLRSDIGYGDERELFFISKKPKQLTNEFVAKWKKEQTALQKELERKNTVAPFIEQKNELAGTLMNLMGKGVSMERIIALQKDLLAISDGDVAAINRLKNRTIAAERHARRTAEDEKKIRQSWSLRKEANRLRSSGQYTGVRVNYDSGGLMATHTGHNFDKQKGWYEKRVQEIGFNNGHKVILENERGGDFYQKFTEGKWDERPFEIATRETGTANNILRGLKHCADKPKTEIAVLYFPNGFDKDNLANALKRYKSFEKHPERTFVKFKRVVCITDEGIVYDHPL